MKKHFIITFVLTMLMSMAGANALAYDIAVENADGVTIYYNYINDGKELEVTNSFTPAYHEYNYDYAGDLVIPEYVEYNGNTYSVTSIGFEAFVRLKGLNSVCIPSSVTRIESQAFIDCSNLTTVNIPNSVTYIGMNTFSGTAWFNNQPDGIVYAGNFAYRYKGEMPPGTELEIKEGTIGICGNAFLNCSNLESVNIPQSVTYIGDCAFEGCGNLASVIIPNSVTLIGYSAFAKCESLTTITIPKSDILLRAGVFRGCTGLLSVTILSDNIYSEDIYNNTYYVNYDNLTSVFEGCFNIKEVTFDCKNVVQLFKGNTNLKEVTLTESVITIGYDAFNGCSGIISLSIPNNVTTIEYKAFSGCSGLASISIPQSVTSIGSSAFENCSGLTSIAYLCNIDMPFVDIFRGCPNIKEATFNCKIVHSFFKGLSSLEKVTMLDDVTTIGIEAFMNCSSLSSLFIPNGVVSIGASAFEGCSGLRTLSIPSTVNTIDKKAFDDCSGITDIYCYAEDVPETYYNAFYGTPMDNLTLYVPANAVEEYKASAVWGRFKTIVPLENPPVSGDTPTTDDTSFTDDGIIYAVKDDGTLEVTGLEAGTTMVDILSDVTINGKTYQVTSIGERAFEGRSDIEYLSIPWSVTSIGEYAFIDCGSNIKVNIADPESWCQMELGNEHSSPLSSAGRVLVHDIETTSIDIPVGVTSIGNLTFYQCHCITSLNIPGTVRSIGSSAFEDCTGLTSLSLSEGLEIIGGSAFQGCTGLQTLTIPSTVNAIYINALAGCKAITDVYCFAENVPDTHTDAFDATPTEKSTLHVPANAVEAYRKLWPWSDFKEIVAIEQESPDAIQALKQTEDCNGGYYDLTGRKVYQPQKGLYIRNGKKVMIK